MYIPRKFALSDDETKAALAQAGFAQLVTHDSTGMMVTPLPLLVRRVAAFAGRPCVTGQPALARRWR
jgi:predicted FMN-binding regulatory protein PaiB